MSPQQEPLPIWWQKRIFDLVVSLCLLTLLSPVFLFFMALIFIEHCLHGRPLDPLFYAEKRVSRGVLFTLYKFNIFNQKVIDEHRQKNIFIHTKELEWNGGLIYVGKVLKQIYLDELPQLYNVVRGEMSLVGPRPLNPKVYAHLETLGVPPQALICSGMTGNFQSLKDTRGATMFELEADYIRKYRQGSGWNIVGTDICIITRTIKVLLRAQGV